MIVSVPMSMVGRTPWSARDAPVPLFARRIKPRVTAAGRRGGRPRTRGSAPPRMQVRSTIVRATTAFALAAAQGDQRAVHRHAAAHLDAQQRREGDQSARVVADAGDQVADALRIANE